MSEANSITRLVRHPSWVWFDWWINLPSVTARKRALREWRAMQKRASTNLFSQRANHSKQAQNRHSQKARLVK